MTIRITHNERRKGQHPVVVVEGSLDREGAALLDEVFDTMVGGPAGAAVNLAGVVYVDAPAAEKLRELERRGARLEGQNAFVSQLLDVSE